MEWTQFAIFIVTMAGMFAYVRSETKEWRKEHKDNMEKWRREHKEDIKEIHKDAKAMNAKWESLFKLFVELKLKSDK